MKILSALLIGSSVLIATPAFAAENGQLIVTQTPSALSSAPLGAQRIPMLTLTLRASCDAPVTIQTISIQHTGLGALSDISRIYLMDNVSRISRPAVLQQKTTSALVRPMKLVIDACQSKTIIVAMDLSPHAAAGSQHALKINDASAIQTNAIVSVLSNNTTTPATLSTTPSAIGSIAFMEVPTASRNVLFGKNRTLLRFTLKASGKSTQAIDAMTFTNDGSATNADIRNLGVYTTTGELLSAESASLQDDSVRIVFHTPLLLEQNATRLLQLRGDVTASKRRTIDMTVKETSDIEAHIAKNNRM